MTCLLREAWRLGFGEGGKIGDMRLGDYIGFWVLEAGSGLMLDPARVFA